MDFIQKHQKIAKILIGIASISLIAASVLPFLPFFSK